MPRLLPWKKAAGYLGVSIAAFGCEVAKDVWRRRMRRGDTAACVTNRIALDAAADAASGLTRHIIDA